MRSRRPFGFNQVTLLTLRRFVLGSVLAGAVGWTAHAEKLPAASIDAYVAVSDTTTELSWAGRLIRLHSTLELINAQPAGDDVPRLVSIAFSDAQKLARTSGLIESPVIRALYVDTHQLYEQHYGAVAPIALTQAELVEVRAGQFAMLLASDFSPLHGEVPGPAATEPEPEADEEAEPEAELLTVLSVPESAEQAVAEQQQRMIHRQGGLRGMQQVGRSYFPMITRALRRRGIPEELKYIAVIESSLDPNAESGAGAIGLWQFMPDTGAMYGLTEEDLRSPSRSTVAAARHLERLGVMFDGDWQLALAAYNGGDGRVLAAVRQARRQLGRVPTFWDIAPSLPSETRNYVAKFIATARVMGG